MTGGPVFKTITFFVQMLRPGEQTLPLRQTASLLVAPFEGAGIRSSTASASTGRSSTRSPSRAVPGTSTSTAIRKNPAILFIASDEPALKGFDLYKKWGRDAAGDIVKLALRSGRRRVRTPVARPR